MDQRFANVPGAAQDVPVESASTTVDQTMMLAGELTLSYSASSMSSSAPSPNNHHPHKEQEAVVVDLTGNEEGTASRYKWWTADEDRQLVAL